MRINDDQRRKVAQELSELRHTTYYSEEIVENICDAISIADPVNTFREPEDVYKLLADLIEPQERTCRRLREFVVYRDGSTGEYRVACSACGFSADPQEWAETYNFCPRCGAKVVS